VQATIRLNEPFIDLGPPIVIPGAGESTTNFVDVGAITNGSARSYRIHTAP